MSRFLRRLNRLGTVNNGPEDWLLKSIVQLYKLRIAMKISVFAMRKPSK
jgi:hypothetical protein